jgi:hypothetical protein
MCAPWPTGVQPGRTPAVCLGAWPTAPQLLDGRLIVLLAVVATDEWRVDDPADCLTEDTRAAALTAPRGGDPIEVTAYHRRLPGVSEAVRAGHFRVRTSSTVPCTTNPTLQPTERSNTWSQSIGSPPHSPCDFSPMMMARSAWWTLARTAPFLVCLQPSPPAAG